MLSGILWKLGKPLGLHALTRIVRDIAEAKPGTDPRLTRAYWALAGKKVWIGLALKLAAAVLYGLGEVNAAIAVVSVGAFCLTAGFVDRAWRTELPDAITKSGVYRFLSMLKAEITTTLAAATVYFYSAECAGPHCADFARLCVVLTVIAFEFGLIDAAAKSPTPNTAASDDKFAKLAAAESKVIVEKAAEESKAVIDKAEKKLDDLHSGPDGDSSR